MRLLKNMYARQEETFRFGHELFKQQGSKLNESQAKIKIPGAISTTSDIQMIPLIIGYFLFKGKYQVQGIRLPGFSILVSHLIRLLKLRVH